MTSSPNNQPSGVIAIRAWVNDEYASVDFAILRLNRQWAEETIKRISFVEPLRNEAWFHCISYFDRPDGYYCHSDEDDSLACDLEANEFYKKNGWCYVELTPEDQKQLQETEQSIDAECIRLFVDGDASFVGYGKHTSIEFSTDTFPAGSIVSRYLSQ